MRFALGLGSNLGDRLGHLRSAVASISGLGRILAVSSLFETDPVGGPEQPGFLNAVVVIESALEPLALLAELHRIEAERDRTREVRWGPRTLDIDVLVADGVVSDSETLTLPHPRARDRRFVLAPLVAVWPEVLVADGVTATEALVSLRGQRVFEWNGDWTSTAPNIGARAKAWVSAQLVLMTVWVLLAFATGEPSSSGWVVSCGALVAASGAVQGFLALRRLGSELSVYPQAREGATLVANGPYRLVRHPIYGAILLGAAGIAVLQESWAGGLGVLVLTAFFLAKSSIEERSMVLTLSGYEAYRRQVRRRFIPWLI